MDTNTKEYSSSILKKIDDSMSSLMALLAHGENNTEVRSRLDTLKLIKSELVRENGKLHSNVQYKMLPQEELKLLSTMKKSHEETIEGYMKVNNTKSAESERAELSIIMEYLPKMPSKEETESFIREIISLHLAENGTISIKDMGRILPKVKEKYPLVDGKLVKDIILSYQQ